MLTDRAVVISKAKAIVTCRNLSLYLLRFIMARKCHCCALVWTTA